MRGYEKAYGGLRRVARRRVLVLRRTSVTNVDNVITVPKDSLEAAPVGRLTPTTRRRFDAALRGALDIRS